MRNDKEKTPIMNVIVPIILGNRKSFSVTFFKYPPGTVAIKTLVIEKTVTRKHAAATVAVFNSLFKTLSLLLSDMIRFATIVIENPHNNELIKMI